MVALGVAFGLRTLVWVWMLILLLMLGLFENIREGELVALKTPGNYFHGFQCLPVDIHLVLARAHVIMNQLLVTVSPT